MPKITVETVVNAPVEKAWECFTGPAHIVQWNHASDDWHCPRAENDLTPGGTFNFRMEARDGSQGFDFAGTNEVVEPPRRIVYEFGGRRAEATFAPEGAQTRVTVSFDPEQENPPEMQRQGWQAILDNFKKHAEAEQ